MRESHEPDVVAAHGEAANEIVALPLDGSAVDDPARVRVLVTGPDFVHSPVVTGTADVAAVRLAWIQWAHPRMPWDGTELVVAELVVDGDGAPELLVGRRTVAGGPEESVVQPGFLADGSLAFCTDRTGWWNPWREVASGRVVPLLADGGAEVEIGGPLWEFGSSWFTFLADGRIAYISSSDGIDHLAVDGEEIELDLTQIVDLHSDGARLLFVGAAPTESSRVFRLDPVSGELETLSSAAETPVAKEYVSVARPVSFPTGAGKTAHALLYAPVNPGYVAPPTE